MLDNFFHCQQPEDCHEELPSRPSQDPNPKSFELHRPNSRSSSHRSSSPSLSELTMHRTGLSSRSSSATPASPSCSLSPSLDLTINLDEPEHQISLSSPMPNSRNAHAHYYRERTDLNPPGQHPLVALTEGLLDTSSRAESNSNQETPVRCFCSCTQISLWIN